MVSISSSQNLTKGGLLRAGIASSSNEHRLGANEAPPGIISAFLGDHLNEVLNAIVEKREIRDFAMPHLQTVKVGGTVLDLKVGILLFSFIQIIGFYSSNYCA